MYIFLGFMEEHSLIHRLPTDLEVGDIHKDDGYGLGERAGGFPGLPAMARAQSSRRPVISGSNALLQSGECTLAPVTRARRSLEFSLEALRPAEQRGSV